MKKIYLASPFFDVNELCHCSAILNQLRANKENEVYAPMEHQIENAWDMPNEEWAKKVFEMDIEAIKQCDEVWVINYGLYSDTGTAWECGYAYALGKPIHQVVFNKEIYSLMMINGSTEVVNFFGFPVKIEQK